MDTNNYTLIIDTKGPDALGGHVWWKGLHAYEVLELFARFNIDFHETELPYPGEVRAGGTIYGLTWEIHNPETDSLN
jgi:hypothetical protein